MEKALERSDLDAIGQSLTRILTVITGTPQSTVVVMEALKDIAIRVGLQGNECNFPVDIDASGAMWG